MNFMMPDSSMIRRSDCGQYLIEKVAIYHLEPCTSAHKLHAWTETSGECPQCGARRVTYRYVLWQYVRSLHGFDTAQEAVDEAKSLQAEAAASWARVKAAASAQEVQAAGACATSAPENPQPVSAPE